MSGLRSVGRQLKTYSNNQIKFGGIRSSFFSNLFAIAERLLLLRGALEAIHMGLVLALTAHAFRDPKLGDPAQNAA